MIRQRALPHHNNSSGSTGTSSNCHYHHHHHHHSTSSSATTSPTTDDTTSPYVTGGSNCCIGSNGIVVPPTSTTCEGKEIQQQLHGNSSVNVKNISTNSSRTSTSASTTAKWQRRKQQQQQRRYQQLPYRIRQILCRYDHLFTSSSTTNRTSCATIAVTTGSVVLLLILLFIGGFWFRFPTRVLVYNNTGSIRSTSGMSHHLRLSSTNPHHSASSSSSSFVTIDMKEYLQQPQNMLRPMDYQYYTIRINTWERPEQLRLSIQHHLSCPSVLQIQIVWCIDQAIAIPDWLIQMEQTIEPIRIEIGQSYVSYPRLVIERHTINSLNERFHPIATTVDSTGSSTSSSSSAMSSSSPPPPTAAILSIDDDVLRPCIALDHTFYIWLRNPDRQVGFDARSHEVVDTHHHHHHHHHQDTNPPPTATTQVQQQWKYSYMSVTEKTNLYSLTLTRYSFFHQHYMTLYMNNMPSIIRTTIDQNFNCEDIAMSMYISACHTQHKVPLLAHLWAVKSQIKMYVAQKISGSNHHKDIRDECVHTFSQLLMLQKDPEHPMFHTVPLHLGKSFQYGDIPENWNDPNIPVREDLSPSLQHAITTVERWEQQSKYDNPDPSSSSSSSSQQQQQHGPEGWMKEWQQYREDTIRPIYEAGYIEKTIPWQRKFSK